LEAAFVKRSDAPDTLGFETTTHSAEMGGRSI
jgi:hypothetical protein